MKLQIRCRLGALLREKNVSPADLAAASGISEARVREYLDAGLDAVSLGELAALMTALDADRLQDVLELAPADDPAATPPGEPARAATEDEWESVCPASLDARHIWFKDMDVSDTVYQEFVCRACGKRISVIL